MKAARPNRNGFSARGLFARVLAVKAARPNRNLGFTLIGQMKVLAVKAARPNRSRVGKRQLTRWF